MNITFKAALCLIAILVGSSTQGLAIDSIIAFILIVAFGIPHGATDHVLNNFISNKKIDNKPSLPFMSRYLLAIAAYGLMWFFFPFLSLLIFLIISAFHFGEAQFQAVRSNQTIKALASFFWGSSALAILLFTKGSSLSAFIAPHLISPGLMNVALDHRLPFIASLAGLTSVFSFMISFRTFLKETIELGLIFTVAFNTSLLFAFATFFAFWHSRDAVAHQLKLLRPMNLNLKKWVKLAMPYTLISVFGIGMLLVLFLFYSAEFPLITAFFILVALITLPHVIVMSTFYRRA